MGAADAAKGLFDEFFVGSGRSNKKGEETFCESRKVKNGWVSAISFWSDIGGFKNFDMLTTN